MVEHFLMGNTLFTFHSPRKIFWKPEDNLFRYEGEEYRQEIIVDIEMVSQLPSLIMQKEYWSDNTLIGLDESGNEVREYTALYAKDHPRYAVSVHCKNSINVYFLENCSVWENPNTRIWNLLHLENILLSVDSLVLHCSYLMYQGTAILFSAPSGTGKTTQAKLWEKLYSSRIINGDKAIIQNRNGSWFACGYPFHGSAMECENRSLPIRSIVVVRQDKTNWVEELRPSQKLGLIYSECTINSWNQTRVQAALNLLGDLVMNVSINILHCTMEDAACHTLHHYLEENGNGTL